MGGELLLQPFLLVRLVGPGNPSCKVASVCLLVPSARDDKESAEGCPEHPSPTGSGAGYTGEEWGGGENPAVGQISLAGSPLCLGW